MKTLQCNTSWVINKNNTVGGEIYTYFVYQIQKTRLKLCLVAVTVPFPFRWQDAFRAKIGLKGGFEAEGDNVKVWHFRLVTFFRKCFSNSPNLQRIFEQNTRRRGSVGIENGCSAVTMADTMKDHKRE